MTTLRNLFERGGLAPLFDAAASSASPSEGGSLP
jgi:hypothetical protein